jgi:ribosomal 50S subunit-recycling heat shock protein
MNEAQFTNELNPKRTKLQTHDPKPETRNRNSELKLETFVFDLRLDLFLKASRLCSRRTLAQTLCDAGRVSVNGKAAKPAHPVKPGDEISIQRREQITTIRVLSVPGTRQTSRKEAGNLYEVLSDQHLDPLDPGGD